MSLALRASICFLVLTMNTKHCSLDRASDTWKPNTSGSFSLNESERQSEKTLWCFTRLSLCMFVCFAEMLSSSSTRSTSLLCLSSIKLKDTSIKLFLPVFQNSKNKYWSLHSCGLIVSCLLITFSHQTLIAGNKWCRSWKYKNMFVILVACPSSFFPKWRDFRLN